MIIDDNIIKGCKKRDRNAQEALVRQFGPTLFAICNRYCYNQSMGYDALQETFLNVFKYIDTYKFEGSFEGWLRRIAVRSSIALIKKVRPFDLNESEAFMESKMDVQGPIAYSELGVEEIKLIMNKLPKSLSMVFNLYIVEGYSHKEISEILEIAEATSRANLTKARYKLMALIHETESHLSNVL